MLAAFNPTSTASTARIAAREKSEMAMALRRSTRSTSAPDRMPNSNHGRNANAASAATVTGLRVRDAASKGKDA
jgi:hypothetical protein